MLHVAETTRACAEGFIMANVLPIYAAGSGYQGDNTIHDVRVGRDPRLFVLLKEPGLETDYNITVNATDMSWETGDSLSKELLPVMKEHYRLAYIRKPEFMGNTREEEWDNDYYKIVRDVPWGLDSIVTRDNQYRHLSDAVEHIWHRIPDNRKDTYSQLVKYPVQAAAQMNRKMISAQKARHGLSDWRECEAAFDSIVSLTESYNRGFHNNGKWNRMIDCQPRRLPVFDKVKEAVAETPMSDNPAPFQIPDYELKKSSIVTSLWTMLWFLTFATPYVVIKVLTRVFLFFVR